MKRLRICHQQTEGNSRGHTSHRRKEIQDGKSELGQEMESKERGKYVSRCEQTYKTEIKMSERAWKTNKLHSKTFKLGGNNTS